jgi:hypothetical protein
MEHNSKQPAFITAVVVVVVLLVMPLVVAQLDREALEVVVQDQKPRRVLMVQQTLEAAEVEVVVATQEQTELME